MEKAYEAKLIENLQTKTGKSLDQWIALVKHHSFDKHGKAVEFLKSTYQLGHNYADMVVHKANKTDSGSALDVESLVGQSFKGKEKWRNLYEALSASILQLGVDAVISPKKGYISFRRKKQFVTLQPATSSRFEVGIFLKGQPEEGILKLATKPNAMHSHLIEIHDPNQKLEDILSWIKKSYENAG